MDILLLLLYFGLSFILFELGKIISGINRKLYFHRIIVLSILLVLHICLIFLVPDSFRNPVIVVPFLLLTSLFTLGATNIKNIFYKNFIQNLQKPNNLSFFVYICNLDYHSKALLTLRQLTPLLVKENINYTEFLEQINQHSEIKNYLLWNRDVLAVLWSFNQKELAVLYFDTLTIDLSQPGVPLDLISIIINILLKKQEYPAIIPYFSYIQTYYQNVQYRKIVLFIYFSFYASTGCSENFNLLLYKNPALKSDPIFSYWQAILYLKTDRVEQGLSLLKQFKSSLPPHYHNFLPQVEEIIRNPSQQTAAPEKATEIARTILPPQGEIVQSIPEKSQSSTISGGIIVLCGLVLLATLVQFALILAGTRFDFITFKDVVPLDFIRLGAYSDFFINNGEWARLLAAMFLHAGWIHLAVNIYGLFITGRFVEKAYGTFNMVLIFLISGVVGNIASHIISPYPLSVGASGGVFGLLAAIFVFVFWHRKTMNKTILQNFLINFVIIIGINIMFGLQNPRINNIAHFGGFAGGLGISILYLFLWKYLHLKNIVSFITHIAIVLCISFLLIFWPQFYTYDYFNKLDVDKNVSVNGYSLRIPSWWEIPSLDNDHNFIVDFLTGNKILILKDYSTLKDNELKIEIENEIKEYDNKENNGNDYDPGKPLIKLNIGWYSFSLKKKDANNEYYDFITFYTKSFDSSVCRIISYSLKKYSDRFEDMVTRVLDYIKE